MRASKWVALTLAMALASTATTACGILRTPYERQKIQENGGTAKKPNKEQAADAGGGGGEGGGGGAKTAGKKKEDPQIAKEKKEGEKKAGESESLGQRKERLKGQGLLYVLPGAKDRLEGLRPGVKKEAERAKVKGEAEAEKPAKAVQLRHSGNMSAEVSKLEGVVEAIVLVDEKGHAFVALNEDRKVKAKMVKAPREANERIDVKTEGDIPQPIQERIAAKIRAMDKNIGTVHITNSADHVKKFQRYAGQAVKGDLDETAHAAADHITDIWK
ncbi:hypothetical protein EV586_103224 [Tumebacillus sp. BK434]|uniref:hypothetical protein n=1 Tax=Tumebacillus sp. BK434 TaxID=2512169 RepID=UPI001053A13C|nr:hypothetical protein [Tumebacillus sp. BK434]TCP55571.1 hypothetical protein EV586_103224 [Tumebacillus sp. BK434]